MTREAHDASPTLPAGVLMATAHTASLDATERAAIVELCTWAHDHDFGGLFGFLPPDGLHVMATIGDRLVGHAVMTGRRLQAGALPVLQTAYVDAVATAPSDQHLGIGSAVMRRLVDEAAALRYDIGCLESELRGFYEPLGWQRWRGPLAGRRGDELVPTPDQEGIFIHRLPRTPALDLAWPLTVEIDGRIW